MNKLIALLGSAAVLAITANMSACKKESPPNITVVDAGRVTAAEPIPLPTEERSSETTVTAGEQAQNDADLTITSDIRKAMMKDDNLSVAAKNAKVITMGGIVTLRGTVKSDREKERIEAVARSTPGVSSVENYLQVHVK